MLLDRLADLPASRIRLSQHLKNLIEHLEVALNLRSIRLEQSLYPKHNIPEIMRSLTVFKGAKDGVPKKSTTQKPDELVGDEVYLRVTASGVCGTGTYIHSTCKCYPYGLYPVS